MGRQQAIDNLADGGRITDQAQAPGRHDRLGGAPLLQQFGQDLLGDLAADGVGLDQAHQFGQLFGTQGQGGVIEAVGVDMGGDIAADPVGGSLGLGPRRHHRLEVFGHRPLIGEHPGVVDGQAQLVGVAVPLGGRQLGQFGQPGLALGFTDLNRTQIWLWEIAIVAGAFLDSHALGELFALIPEAGFLHNWFARLNGLDLPLNFILTGLLDRREGIHVLDFHLDAKGGVRSLPHRDIDVAAQRALLHVAIRDA